MYHITINEAHKLVKVVLGELMTVEEVAQYIQKLRQEMLRHGVTEGYAIIIDVSDCPVQTREMIEAMGVHMANMPKARAIAVATGNSLARMQIRRLFQQSYARITTNLAEASAWVLSGIEPPNHQTSLGKI